MQLILGLFLIFTTACAIAQQYSTIAPVLPDAVQRPSPESPNPETITDEFNLEFGRMKRAAQRASAAADVGAPPRTRATKRTPPRRRKPARPAH